MPLKSKSRSLNPLLGFLCLSAVCIALWLVTFNGMRDIQDWWWLRSYTPSSDITKLADDGRYSDLAKEIFYLSDPSLVGSSEEFTMNCNENKEYSIVLGCFSGHRNIYIFNVNDPQLPDVEEVTAAHEMLHAAFHRLNNGEIRDLTKLLEDQLDNLENPRVLNLIDVYRVSIFNTPETSEAQSISFLSELHSIFGTELKEVSLELEEHYDKYFIDRSVITEKAEGYAQTFTSISNSIEEFDFQLSQLDEVIDSQQAEVFAADSQIIDQEAKLKELLSDSDNQDYNDSVDEFNSLVGRYNDLVNAYRSNLSKYNSLVKQRNEQAYIQRDLVNAIDGQFLPRETEL